MQRRRPSPISPIRVALGSDFRFDKGLLDPAGPVRALRPLARADRDAILGGVAAKPLKL